MDSILLDIIHTEEQVIDVLQLINMDDVQALVRCVPTQDNKGFRTLFKVGELLKSEIINSSRKNDDQTYILVWE